MYSVPYEIILFIFGSAIFYVVVAMFILGLNISDLISGWKIKKVKK